MNELNLKKELYSIMMDIEDCICCKHYIPTLNGKTFHCYLGLFKSVTTKCSKFERRENNYDGTIQSLLGENND